MKFFFRLILTFTIFAAPSLTWAKDCSAVYLRGKHEIQLELAKKAGLNYISKDSPGYYRHSTGAGKNQIFYYTDSNGKKVTNPKILDRIKKIGMPPAYRDVWIAADPKGHLQAYGKDEKERPQYRYHQIWLTEVKAVSKFERMEEFGHAIAGLRDVVAEHLNQKHVDMNSQLAAAVRIIEVAGIRVGGEKYAEENGSYGTTTLEKKHVHIRGNDILFDFVGKEGVPHKIPIADANLARVLKELLKNKNNSDRIFDLNAADVNAYIKEHSSSEFSAKDFRTWVGTTTAIKILIEKPRSHGGEALKAIETEAITAASERLHNGFSMARDHYIYPRIFEAYRKGQLHELARKLTETDSLFLEEQVLLELLASID